MASKMVTNFRRSVSFPNPPTKPPNSKTLHVRSTSLPSQSHPIISHLRHDIAHLHSWSAAPDSTSAWLCDGLTLLNSAHESLHHLLHLPQTRESLHAARYPHLIHHLLEHFLRLVDVYGIFQTLLLRLREEYSAAQIAVRRKDDSQISVRSTNLNKIAKDIGRLVSDLRCIGKYPVRAGPPHDDEAEIVDVINDVLMVTVFVSASLFGGLSNSLAFRKQSCVGGLMMSFGVKTKNVKVEGGIQEFQEISLEDLRKKAEDEAKVLLSKKMQELEDCVVEIEGCGERAFRSLISTRVSLLNVITQ